MDENPYRAPEGELAKTGGPTKLPVPGCGCLFLGGAAWAAIFSLAAILIDEDYVFFYALPGVAGAIVGALGWLASLSR